MAENETPAESTTPRRRRAASRPSGPPPELTDPFSAPAVEPEPAAPGTAETVAPEVTDPFAAPAEAPARATRRRATRPAAAVASDEEAPQTEEKPVRRRRATRAVAPVETDVPEQASVQAVAPEQAPVQAVAPGQAPVQAVAPEQAPVQTVAPEQAPVQAVAPEQASVQADAPPLPLAADVAAAPAPEPAAPEPETPRRSRRATRATAAPEPVEVVAEVPQTVAAGGAEVGASEVEEQAQPVRRSRRATRATAAPEPVEVVAEVPQTVAAGTAETRTAAADEAPQPTRRRRATRPVAAPEPVEAGRDAPQTGAADSAPEEHQATLVAADAPAQEKASSGRRRSSRSQTQAPRNESSDTADVAIAPADPEQSVNERPSRRRRGEVPVEQESGAAAGEDGIAAALRMAEEAARERRRLVADPFTVSVEGREAQLQALAGAIAGSDEDEDESDETDEVVEDTDEEQMEESSGDADEDDSDDQDISDEDGDDEERVTRRRRRRGGRRRRRGGSRDDSDSSEDSEDPATEESEHKATGDSEDHSDSVDDDAEDADGEGGTRRRRRRRRRGGSSDESGAGSDEVTGIEGSTRMEAKRQRRKENRAAGRRRAPILSEAEFLARRESVDRRMLIRQSDDYTQLAVVEDGILVEHYVDRASATSLIGNIYLGKVQNVLPSMEAAFIDIGRGRNAVLYAGEVDWESFGVSAENRRVEKVFKSGQTVLVQVTKDPVGAKGARLTGHVSLPGRYVVYSPGGHLSGISRKLPDIERARLREILGGLISDEESVIVRTAAEGASPEELVRDVNRLKAQWEVIEKKTKLGKAPEALYAEPDLTLRIVRDLFTEDFGHLVVQGNGSAEDAHDAISAYVSHVAPHLAERLEQFTPSDDGRDLFAEYRIDEQIAKALDRKVYLPSGGSLVIDRTEAMTVIDVNTGKFTGTGGNLEATVTSNNLEAAEEIVRQLRLRDIGGIIVIDFIDMVLPSNRELLLRRLVECLGRDRTRHQVAEVTSLGLVQLTRKRIGTGLAEAFTEECEHCHGAGYLRYDEPVESQAPSDGGERSGRRRNGRRGGKGNGDSK